jgi:thiamine-phosphate pyrophosphorylase
LKKQIQKCSRPIVYLITDRRLVRRPTTTPELTALIDFIERAIAAGIDMIQIRERDLSARQLCSVIGSAGESANILVNDRADVAASSAAGVHLTTRSMPVDVVRAAFGSQILMGASTHTIDEVEAAEAGGADFVVFGPVFETPSKLEYGAPVGLDALAQVATRSRIPVLALGGVNLSNYKRALDAGAAGVAGISMFIEAMDLPALVAEIKSYA